MSAWNPRLQADISDALVRALPFPIAHDDADPADEHQPRPSVNPLRELPARTPAQQLADDVLAFATRDCADEYAREEREYEVLHNWDDCAQYAHRLGYERGQQVAWAEAGRLTARLRHEIIKRDAALTAARDDADFYRAWCWALSLLAVGVMLSGLVWVVAG